MSKRKNQTDAETADKKANTKPFLDKESLGLLATVKDEDELKKLIKSSDSMHDTIETLSNALTACEKIDPPTNRCKSCKCKHYPDCDNGSQTCDTCVDGSSGIHYYVDESGSGIDDTTDSYVPCSGCSELYDPEGDAHVCTGDDEEEE